MHQPLIPLRPALRGRRGWKAAGVAVSIAIAVIAFIALAHALKNIDVHQVLQAIWLTDRWRIALAATLVLRVTHPQPAVVPAV